MGKQPPPPPTEAPPPPPPQPQPEALTPEATAAAAFQRLTPKQLRPVVAGSHMVLVEGVLSLAECQRLIDAATAIGWSHQGSRGPAHGEALRDNDRIQIQSPELAEQLWRATGLKRALEGRLQVPDGGGGGGSNRRAEAVGLNPNLRLYRYRVGQHFGRHYDDAVDLGGGRATAYTLLIYLSGAPGGEGGGGGEGAAADGGGGGSKKGGGGKQQQQRGGGRGKAAAAVITAASNAAATAAAAAVPTAALQPEFRGGETVFYDARGRRVASVAPRPGAALLHLHGDDCLEHAALLVERGCKYVLRSDVVFAFG